MRGMSRATVRAAAKAARRGRSWARTREKSYERKSDGNMIAVEVRSPRSEVRS
jgi:hypothetical protein